MARDHRDERGVVQEPPPLLGAAERTMGQEQEAPLRAQLDQAAAKARVVPRAQLHLHRRDGREVERLAQLAEGHVAQADLLDEAVALEGGQRAHAGGQRGARIRRVELVQEDALDAQRFPAGRAGGGEVARAAVRDPSSARAGEPALGGDAHARPLALPGGERPCDQPLVVPGLARVPAIRVGGVEQGDAGVQGRVHRRQRPRVIAVGRGGQAHGAHGHDGVGRAPQAWGAAPYGRPRPYVCV